MPTVYKIPRKSLPVNKPSDKDKRVWEKHRSHKEKSTKLPTLKN